MQTQERPLGKRIWTGFVRLVGTLFVIALLGLVAYLASERNARTYSLSQTSDQLVVMKGKMLPTGTEPWQPSDKVLADVYGPIPLDGTRLDEATLTRKFSDRDELDRALFGILESLARPRVQSDDPKKMERGVFYLRRAQKLTGITEEQRNTLQALQSDVALYLARIKLDEARRTLAEAMTQLQLAATGQTKNAQRANELAGLIGGPARAFEEAASRALAGLPERRGEPEAEPQPTPPQETSPQQPVPERQQSDAGVRTDSQTMERPEAPPEPRPSVTDGP